MIPADRCETASIPQCWPAWAAALLLSGGCVAPGETSVLRLAREQRAVRQPAELAQGERHLRIARLETADTLAAISAAKAETVRCAARLRAVRADLDRELARLHSSEQDLEAARARSLVIEQQLQPLRALEQQLVDLERLQAETTQRAAALQAEVDAAARTAAVRDGELQARLQSLQAQLAAAQKFDAAMSAAQAAATEVLQSLPPPAAAGEPPK